MNPTPAKAVEKYGISKQEAHEAIHEFLQGCISEDGHDAVILGKQPIDPELAAHNPNDRDVYYWLSISDAAEEAIRMALAASFEEA